MKELIVAVRAQIDGPEYRFSRAGVSYVQNSETRSLLLATEESPYTVVVQETVIPEESFQFKCSHVFVGRLLDHVRIQDHVQTWRWHFDVWPEFSDAVPLYGDPVARRRQEGNIWRFSFEHIHGPKIVNPALLAMEIASDSVRPAVIEKDLVPERLQYKSTYDVLPHPGALSGELGILAPFEDLLQRTKPQTRAWVT